MIRIAVTELEFNKARAVFEAAGGEGLECLPAPAEEAALAAFIREHDIAHAVIGVEPYRDALYEALPRGAVIARFGVGMDGVDRDKAAARGQVCTNTPGALDDSVAEFAVGLILAAARHIAVTAAQVAEGGWPPRVGCELRGRTLAVIGCGAIGRRVARCASAGFGMRVIGCDPGPVDPGALRDAWGVERVERDLAPAVRAADFVSLHIPSIPATRRTINAERLAMLPANAWLINTARGAVVDEAALFDALAAGRLAGAALDVYEHEPYTPIDPQRDLRTLSNVILTPHLGSSTVEACERMARAALDAIRREQGL
ncbi:MAG: hypothetical protein JW951_02410 [Lentisphaerae bacterium]|nr:hypothetical protein [Lentisphaerota bacterium]